MISCRFKNALMMINLLNFPYNLEGLIQDGDDFEKLSMKEWFQVFKSKKDVSEATFANLLNIPITEITENVFPTFKQREAIKRHLKD